RSVPVNAVRAALEAHRLSIRDVDLVCYYEQPNIKLDRIIAAMTMRMGANPGALATGWTEKLSPSDVLRHSLCYHGEVRCFPNLLSHPASAFVAGPFDVAAIVTMDGVGECATTGTFRGDARGIHPLATQTFPHSLGLFYSAAASFLGFMPNSDEYKVMGLASY